MIFERYAFNRVHRTRTGEHGSPLHYFGNCISFIQFIFIINFLSLLGGWIISSRLKYSRKATPTSIHLLSYKAKIASMPYSGI